LLSAYIDDELDAAQCQFVEEHVSNCTACRSVLADYHGIRDLMVSLQTVPFTRSIRELPITSKTSFRSRRFLIPALVMIPVIVLAVILPLKLTFTGLSPDASEIITRAYVAMGNLQSYRYIKDEFTQIHEADTPINNYHYEFQYVSPDRYHFTIDYKAPYIDSPENWPDEFNHHEVYAVEDRLYSPKSDPYATLYLDKGYFSELTPTKEEALNILNTLVDVKTLPEVTIDGTACYHYLGGIDVDKYLELVIRPLIKRMYDTLYKNRPDTGWDFERMFAHMAEYTRSRKTTHELWIGKDDNIIRQWKVTSQKLPGTNDSTYYSGSQGENSAVIVSIGKYFDFNENIVIDPPLSGSGELLPGWEEFTLAD
jgi:hypothetical protein